MNEKLIKERYILNYIGCYSDKREYSDISY